MATSDFFVNGQIGRLNQGTSPGCVTKCGDGTFEDCTTGVGTACGGSGDDYCCDCEGCSPGRCDNDPVNPVCQSYFDTFGETIAGCPPPNTNPCYTIDPEASQLVPDTTNCNCPGSNLANGEVCDPDTGNPRPPNPNEPLTPNPGNPQDQGEENPLPPDENPAGDPRIPVNKCYVSAPELFGTTAYIEIPCRCFELRGSILFRDCVFPPGNEPPPTVECECTYYTVDTGIAYLCTEYVNGEQTDRPCDAAECNCNSDCDPDETCTMDGICVN